MKKNYLSIKFILLITTAIIGGCGVIYELLISSVASYLLGNSIVQFSITIGMFMFSFAIGSLLSKYFKNNLLDIFVFIEFFIGFIGGLSAFVLFWIYGNATVLYMFSMYFIIMLIGILIGMELPVLTRYLNKYEKQLRITLANVLGFDYIGALLGSIAFSLFFLPKLGIIKVAFLIGLFNVLVAILNILQFSKYLNYIKIEIFIGIFTLGILSYGLIQSDKITHYVDQFLYEDKVILSMQTPYQKIVLTKDADELRLFLNGNLQFCSTDEYRYHETLVHVPMLFLPHCKNVLILGGGDGFVARELLKYKNITNIVLVDIDSMMVDLCMNNDYIKKLNKNSLSDAKVHIIYDDAFEFLERDRNFYDLIISDLPDPDNESLAKLYSKQNFRQVYNRLNEYGMFVIQSTSPFFAKYAYWCIGKTLEAADFFVKPYHTDVPSFGDWGFWIASKTKLNLPNKIRFKVPMQYLNSKMIPLMFIFPNDIRVNMDTLKVSTLYSPIILTYYQQSWRNW